MDGGKDALGNINDVSRQLKQTVAEATSIGANGLDAGENIRQAFANASQATGNLQDDSEGLKHNSLLRGFFKKRGYYDLATLTPAEYRSEKIFSSSGNPFHAALVAGLGACHLALVQSLQLFQAARPI